MAITWCFNTVEAWTLSFKGWLGSEKEKRIRDVFIHILDRKSLWGKKKIINLFICTMSWFSDQ